MGLSLKEQLIKAKNQKFKTLYDRIPFLRDMDYNKRTWWIRYYKLKHTWTNNFQDLPFPPDKLLNHHGFTTPKPWSKPDYQYGYLGQNHEINQDLVDMEWLFSMLNYDWVHVKLEDIIFPEIIECNFHPSEGCGDCLKRYKCELKKNRSVI